MVKQLPLSRGYVALVDDEDYDRLTHPKWQARTTKTGLVYAIRRIYIGNYRYRTEHLHRLIAGPPDDMDVDHINRDPLDNRRANLRICSRAQNLANRKGKGASGFKGVFFSRGRGQAAIGPRGAVAIVGSFKTAEAAARAYDDRAKQLYGEFAYLNFP